MGNRQKSREGTTLPFTLDIYLSQMDKDKRYPALDKDTFPPVIAEYRAAVEELYLFRQAGHVDLYHCAECEAAYVAYHRVRALVKLPRSPNADTSSNEGEEQVIEKTRADELFEEAQERVLAFKRKGHLPKSHCTECATVKRRVDKAMRRIVLGSRLIVLSVLNKFCRKRFGNEELRLDLFQEGMSVGVSEALAHYNPHHGTTRPHVRLSTDELGDEKWGMAESGSREGEVRADFISCACHWILSSMERALDDRYYAKPFRFPVQVADALNVMRRALAVVKAQKGESPSREAVFDQAIKMRPSAKRWMNKGHVLVLLRRDEIPVHLDREFRGTQREDHVSPAQKRTLKDFIPDRGNSGEAESMLSIYPLLIAVERFLQRVIEICWTHLSTSKAHIILGYLQLHGGKTCRSMKESGDELGVTRAMASAAWRRGMDELSQLFDLSVGELILARMIYDPLLDLYPHPRKRIAEPLVGLRDGSDLRGVFRRVTLDDLREKFEHAVEKSIPPAEPFRLAGKLRLPSEEDEIIAIIGDSLRQVQALLAVSRLDPHGKRFVDDPCRHLRDDLKMNHREAIHILANLVMRGWIRNMYPDTDTEDTRFSCVQILWEEGMTISPPDIQVAYSRERPRKSVSNEDGAYSSVTVLEEAVEIVPADFDD